MSFEPLVIQTLAATITFALAALTPPRQLIGALSTHRAPIALAACGQTMILPLILFYFLSFISDPAVAVTMITIAAIPAIGLVGYFAYVAGGSVPVALWATFLSVGIAGFLAPGLLPLWLIAAPEVSDAAPSLHVNPVPIFEALIFMHIVPMTAGYAVRAASPSFVARFAPSVAHASAVSIVIYPVATLPITDAYMASAWETQARVLVLYGCLSVMSTMFIMALTCDRPSKIAMMFLIPSKLTLLPLTANYIASDTVAVDPAVLMTWTALQFLFGAALATFYAARSGARANEDPTLPAKTASQGQ